MGKKKTENKTTKKPTGLKIPRKGNKFSLSWKMPSEKYGKGVQYATSDHTTKKKSGKKTVTVKAWSKAINIGKNKTAKDIEINVKKYCPWTKKTASFIAFRVRGHSENKETKKTKYVYSQSKWTSKSFPIKKPKKPSISYTRSTAYTTSVTVSLPSSCSATSKYWATRIYCRHCLQAYNSKTKSWYNLRTWETQTKDLISGPSNLTFTINHGDESTKIENATSTRVIIQARLAGPAGYSNNYGSAVQKTFSYSAPNIPVITKAIVSANNKTKKLDCSIKFTYTNDTANPIQNIKVMYAFAAPNIDLTSQDADWQEASISGSDNIFVPEGSGKHTAYIPFTIPQLMPDDTLLYVKVVATNNGKETHSEEMLCRTSDNKVPNSSIVLTKPVINGVSAPIGNKVTVDVTNMCLANGSAPAYEEVDNPVVEDIKKYFERNYVKVAKPTQEDLEDGKYFEWDDEEKVFYPSEDEEIDPETTYYIFDGTYFITKDTVINDEKTYYQKAGEPIDKVLIVLEFLPNKLQSSYDDMIVGVIETNPSDQSQDYSYTVEIPPDYTSSFKIGAYALIGQCELFATIPLDYDKADPPIPGYKKYVVTQTIVRSERETFGGFIPLPPSEVNASHLGDGNVLVTWNWDWTEADSAEVAWSDYSEALDSTEPPSTYTVSNQKSGRLIIRNLEMGKAWNFWVRLIKDDNASIWSNPASESLMSSPNIPSLVLSKEAITIDETVTASWAYVSGDNSPQGMAEVCIFDVDTDGNLTPGKIIAKIPENADDDPERQYVVIDPKTQDPPWISGETYNLGVRVVSQNGLGSISWSAAQPLKIVDPLDCSIMSTSLKLIDSLTGTELPYPTYYDPTATYSIGDHVLHIEPDSDEDGNNPFNRQIAQLYIAKQNIGTPEEWTLEHWNYDENNPVLKLTSMPMDIVVYRGPENTTSTIKIERSEDYFIERPDNDGTYGGYEGEIIYEDSNGGNYFFEVEDPSGNPSEQNYYEFDSETDSYVPTSDTEVVSGKTYYYISDELANYRVELDDLFGYMDDDASYYLTYIIEDSYGQHAEMRYEFDIKWDHQAIDPNADVWIEDVTMEDEIKSIAKIRINNPNPLLVEEGDYCDIYRVSADGFDLIYEKAQFGETYVDPYPTIGEHGGHRIVYKTLYGDYITAEGSLAMLDILSDETDNLFECDGNLIDFGDESVKLMFNMDISNNWSKDFQQTKYLGGSIQGDWNVGISMSSSLSANVITNDWATISKIRNLAQYADVCHVRTRDGMNYLADVQVSERIPYEAYFTPENEVTNVGEYSFSITKVDPIDLDGMTLKEWEDSISEYEIPEDPDEGV